MICMCILELSVHAKNTSFIALILSANKGKIKSAEKDFDKL